MSDVQRQLTLLRQSNRIQRELTQLLLQGGDLNDLVSMLAERLSCSVCIDDTSFFILAAADFGAVDEARRQSVLDGRASMELAQQLIDTGLYERFHRDSQPLWLDPLPDIGMTQGRLIAPIVIGNEVYGHLWLITDDQPLDELQQIIVEHGITTAALMLQKEYATREARHALSGDLFEGLLRNPEDQQRLSKQAEQVGYRFEQPHQVLLISGIPADGGSRQAFSDAVEDWLRDQQQQALTVWREHHLILVLESGQADIGTQLAHSLFDHISSPPHALLIGVAQPYASSSSDGLRRSYAQAQEVVEINRRLGKRKGVARFDELGLLHWLFLLSPEQHRQNQFAARVATLSSYDAKHRTELIKTLENYVEAGASLVATAERLHIHRNTLIKRIERIEQLLDLGLDDPLVLINLYLASMSDRLQSRLLTSFEVD